MYTKNIQFIYSQFPVQATNQNQVFFAVKVKNNRCYYLISRIEKTLFHYQPEINLCQSRKSKFILSLSRMTRINFGFMVKLVLISGLQWKLTVHWFPVYCICVCVLGEYGQISARKYMGNFSARKYMGNFSARKLEVWGVENVIK